MTFFLEYRIKPQLRFAYQKGFSSVLKKHEQQLLDMAAKLLVNHRPQASLVHGDLWGGNKGFLNDGTPIIFDPACYYGDAETDLAMLELFGHPSNQFYETYDKGREIAPGREIRKHCYNLYHILNHANLFGGGYLSQANGLIKDIISAIIR